MSCYRTSEESSDRSDLVSSFLHDGMRSLITAVINYIPLKSEGRHPNPVWILKDVSFIYREKMETSFLWLPWLKWFQDLTVFAVFSRPVCPSGDGGVLESCCFSSPSDPSPYSTWPSISSASLAGEQQDVRAPSLTFPHTFVWHPPLFLFHFVHFIILFMYLSGALRSLCFMGRSTRRNNWKSGSSRTCRPRRLVYWR